MKRISIGIAAIASLLSTSAFAADMAPRMYTKAPAPIVEVYNWTGFYIGGNVGYSWGRSRDDSTLTNTAGTVLFASSDRSDLNGVLGGGQIGYNWQMQNWVWGLEADIQATDEKGSRFFTCPTGVCTPTFGVIAVFPGPAVPVSPLDQKIEWFGTVRGRAGILAAPKVLLYATGGLAYGEVRTAETIGAGLFGFSNTDTRVGYTVGAGVEGSAQAGNVRAGDVVVGHAAPGGERWLRTWLAAARQAAATAGGRSFSWRSICSSAWRLHGTLTAIRTLPV